MRRSKRGAVFLVPFILIAGCAPRYVDLAPKVSVPEAAIGNGTEIAVRVSDQRAETEIAIFRHQSHRRLDLKYQAKRDVADVVGEAVAAALKKLDFRPTRAPLDVPRVLTVHIRRLRVDAYSASVFDTVTYIGNSDFDVIAKNATSKLERRFHGRARPDARFESVESKVAKAADEALRHAIEGIFADRKLLDFLARPSPQSQ